MYKFQTKFSIIERRSKKSELMINVCGFEHRFFNRLNTSYYQKQIYIVFPLCNHGTNLVDILTSLFLSYILRFIIFLIQKKKYFTIVLMVYFTPFDPQSLTIFIYELVDENIEISRFQNIIIKIHLKTSQNFLKFLIQISFFALVN